MNKLSEPQKVQKIVKALENEIQGPLYLNDTENRVGEIIVSRRGFGSELGSPDAVIWVELNLRVLGISVSVRTPILVEAEDAGINAAKEDIRKFFERDDLEIPMIVVGRTGALSKKGIDKATARINVPIHQIGLHKVIDD